LLPPKNAPVPVAPRVAATLYFRTVSSHPGGKIASLSLSLFSFLEPGHVFAQEEKEKTSLFMSAGLASFLPAEGDFDL
jgi:hypothetical protein